MPSSSNFNLIMIKGIHFVCFNITAFLYVSFFFLNLDYGILFYAQIIFLCCSGIACVAGLNDGPKICEPHKKYEEGKIPIVDSGMHVLD